MAFESPEERAEREIAELMAQMNPEPKGQEVSHEEDGTTENQQGAAEEGQEPAAHQDDPNGDTFKQRWLTLQGIFNAERDRWALEKANLLNTIEEIKQQKPAREEDLTAGDDYRSPHVTDHVRQSLPYRRMVAEFDQRYAELHFESIAVASGAGQQRQEQAPAEEDTHARFLMQLDRLHRNWRTLNNDTAFGAWLDAPVPYSGTTRRGFLNAAVEAGNAPAAAQFFIDFEDSKRTQAPPTAKPDDLVSPPRRGSVTQSTVENNQGKVYTRSEWDKAWDTLALGKMPPAEAAALERELVNASNQGRVIG